jgi:hypothetical protein
LKIRTLSVPWRLRFRLQGRGHDLGGHEVAGVKQQA